MREFRFLEEKRKQGGLTATEEARWSELRGLLGEAQGALPLEEPAAADYSQPQGYYGPDGQWYASPQGYAQVEYPEGYDPNQPYTQPQGYYGADGQWYAYPEGYPQPEGAQQGYDPNAQPQGYYGADGQWYAYPEGYPQPEGAQQGYDPNAQPAQPQGYYGPDGQWYAYPGGYAQVEYPQQDYDPSQPYDPNAAPYDTGQPYDPNAAYDPNAPQAAYAHAPAYAPPLPAAPPSSPESISLESDEIDIPALSEPAPWAEPDSEPPEAVHARSESPEPSSAADDMLEASDADLSFGDSALEDMGPAPDAALPAASDEPMALGETDFSSVSEEPAAAGLSSDLDFSSLNEPAMSEPAPLLDTTAELPEQDLSLSSAEPDMALAAEYEPGLPQESLQPSEEDWSSAPLAMELPGEAAYGEPSEATPTEGDFQSALPAPEQPLQDSWATVDPQDFSSPWEEPPQETAYTPATESLSGDSDSMPSLELGAGEAQPWADPLATPESMYTLSSTDIDSHGSAETAPAEEQPTFDVDALGAELESTPAPAHDAEPSPLDAFTPGWDVGMEQSSSGRRNEALDIDLAGDPAEAVPLASPSDFLDFARDAQQDDPSATYSAPPVESLELASRWTQEDEIATSAWGENTPLWMPTPEDVVLDAEEAAAAADPSAPPIALQSTWAELPPMPPERAAAEPPSELPSVELQSDWAEPTPQPTELPEPAEPPSELPSVELQSDWAELTPQPGEFPEPAEPAELSAEPSSTELQSDWAEPTPQPTELPEPAELSAEPSSTELQPGWEESPATPVAAQPEWDTSTDQQSAWSMPVEEPAATDWSNPEDPQSAWAPASSEQPTWEASAASAGWSNTEATDTEVPASTWDAPAEPAQAEWTDSEAIASPTEPSAWEAAPQSDTPVLEASPEELEPAWGASPAAQADWSAPAEETAPAQPEWSPTDATSEWNTPAAEPQDWSAPSSASTDWSATAEEAAPVQPEWSPTDATSEWSPPAAEPQDWSASSSASTDWSTTAEEAPPAQPEWSPSEATSEWNTPAAEPQDWSAPSSDAASWSVPVAEARPEWPSPASSALASWNEPEPAPDFVLNGERDLSAFGSSDSWASDTETLVEEDWSAAEPEVTSSSTEDLFASPIGDLAMPDPVPVALPAAPPAEPPPPPASTSASLEVELPEIDLEEAAVEITPPPPPPLAAQPLPSSAVARPIAPVAPAVPPAAPRPAVPAMPVAAQAPAPAAPTVAAVSATISLPPAARTSLAPPVVSALEESSQFDVVEIDDAPSEVDSTFIQGEHRVIIHTVEGQVKRGTIRDTNLLDEALSLEQQVGMPPERISGKRLKAVFFMLTASDRQPQTAGQKIRVTFKDGRQVAGFSADYKSPNAGFFVIPADNRTNTARIFIYRSSVQAIAEG